MNTSRAVALLALILATALSTTAAHAAPAPPPNDDRGSAQALDPLPAAVDGTTVGATTETGEFASRCGRNDVSVWYTTTASQDGRVAITVAAHGDLDLVVDVYKKVRSQLTPLNCDLSDSKGNAATDFTAKQGVVYLIRVSQQTNSVAGAFDLHVSSPVLPAAPPGKQLPHGGVTAALDRVQNPDDAWSYYFHAGVSYRIHLSGRDDHCTTGAEVFVPGTTSFDDDESDLTDLDCGDYRLVTPKTGESGRYSIRVLANTSFRGRQVYHLQVAPAGPDDTAPGIALHSGVTARGSLSGSHVDLLDLYRFTVTQRSVTYLTLNGGDNLFLQLLSLHGGHIADGDGDATLRLRIRPGHYFVAVRADGNGGGRYRLRRSERLITSAHISLTGGLGGVIAHASTRPAAGGVFEMTFERFDPLAGWLFAKEVHAGGSGSVTARYVPPGPGRYRVRAVYLGSKKAAGSRTGYAYLEIPDKGDDR